MSFLDTKQILFSERLRLLRNEYMLTTEEMARLLGFKRQSSISNFESNRSYPSFEALVRIMLTFGVSLHWLIGYSVTEYDDEVLSHAETVAPDISVDDIPDEYNDEELRKKNYSRRARGNILFLRHLIELKDDDALQEKALSGIVHLKKILVSKVVMFGYQDEQIEQSISPIIKTFNLLQIEAIPGFKSIFIKSAFEIPMDFQMNSKDILYFCVENYDASSGAACYFIEKMYPTIKNYLQIHEDQKQKKKLEEIWGIAYKIRDSYKKV
ncbi:helix-turn-helix domain-containing protein [Megasphaera elsdenii]|uniref:helix-turn-helix domain-containing protein n=1 Tax=Megasphaera elsdenii TaxID=907 RepID=UPI00242A5168|nr:helix-turn-helix transcriptional regulator [Megasphaera elsdenii]